MNGGSGMHELGYLLDATRAQRVRVIAVNLRVAKQIQGVVLPLEVRKNDFAWEITPFAHFLKQRSHNFPSGSIIVVGIYVWFFIA
jgi:hypothetical protein